MAKKYLDDSGMSYFWGKLKAYFQEKLVSGTNIKTINNESLLGSGDIVPKIKGARWVGECTGNLSDAQTFHVLSAFSGSSYFTTIPDSNYFEAHPYGIAIKQKGYYFCIAFIHANTSAATTQIAIEIYNAASTTSISRKSYFQSAGSKWVDGSVCTFLELNAGAVVAPRIQKYTNDTTTTYRPSTMVLVVLKVE